MKSDIQRGAWIVSINKIISEYDTDHPAFDPFEVTIQAGRAGELFSATRSLGRIGGDKLDLYRKLFRLKPNQCKAVLQIALKLGYIDLQLEKPDDFSSVRKFLFINDSKENVFEAVGKVFLELGPTKVEEAVLEILAETMVLPQTQEYLRLTLSENGYSPQVINEAVRLSESLSLTSTTEEKDSGERIVFNPHSFEGDPKEAYKALNGLSPDGRQNALEILEFVRLNPGIPLPPNIDTKIISVLVKTGLVDLSKITTLKHQSSKLFPTAPYLWGVLAKSAGAEMTSDLIDDAKLLLNSLRYGQLFSPTGYGRIKNPIWIINALIRDGAIGVQKPATAIGTDYPLALSRGIVNIVESRLHPGRYSMELMKRDVAKTVQEVIEQGTILPEQEKPTAEDLERAGKFTSPGAIRVETKLPIKLKKCQEEIIFQLRTMRKTH